MMPLPSRPLPLAFGLLLLACAAFGPRAAQAQPEGSQRGAQSVPLRTGWNLVSLALTPDDPTLDVVFEDTEESVFVVKDADGRHYSSSLNVIDLSAWAWDEAYAIYAESPGTIEVEGTQIDPAASPIALAAGWHWIPYLSATALPVEDALASILPRLTVVRAADGRTYRPSTDTHTLTTLEPGQGYKVFVTGPSTLVYPAAEDDGGGEDDGGTSRTAPTIAAALALRDLTVGDVVEVEGYYAPGDGGGGRFAVEASGATPNGGTVFVPDEHQSPVRTAEAEFRQGTNYVPDFPDGQDVVFGSLTVDLLDGSGNRLLRMPGRDLHGHQFDTHTKQQAHFRYNAGTLRDYNGRMRSFFTREVGEGGERRVRYTYRHTTGPMRLRRLDVGETLNVHWFGARPRADDPTFDNQPVICQAINVANNLNEANPGSVTTILLPRPVVYEYFGTVEMGDGLTLKGAGGTELVTVTNDLGHTYQPVRLRASRTTLRLRADEALTHLRMLKRESDPFHLAEDVKQVLNTRPTVITVAHAIMTAGLEDIHLDGNWQGNMQAWDDGWGTQGEFEDWLRNAPGWAGFIGNNHGNRRIPQGQRLTLRNVAILGYAANGILGSPNNTWAGENVLLGDALYNHVIYGSSGDYKNLTFTGFAWGHVVWYYGRIENLVYEGGALNPIERYTSSIFAIRGGDVYDAAELTGDPVFTQEDGTLAPGMLEGTEIVGFYGDLRGSNTSALFNGIGPNIVIRGQSSSQPGILVPDPSLTGTALYHENANGYQQGLYPNNRFEHILLYDTHTGGAGGGGYTQQSVLGYVNLTNSVMHDVRTERPRGRAARTLTLTARRRDHPAWDAPQTLLFDGIVENGPTEFVANVEASTNVAGLEVFIRDSRFDNNSNTLFRTSDGTGRLSGLGSNADVRASKIRVFFEGSEFRLRSSNTADTESFFSMSRFRNCTERNTGRRSEDAGTLGRTAAGGERSLDVATNLFWSPPLEHITFGGSSAGLVDRVEVIKPSGDPREPSLRFHLRRALAAGERVDLTWEAAVRPWEDGVVMPPTTPNP